FKLDKNKRFKLTLEVFRDIFQICPRVPGRDFDSLPSEEDTVSFLRELGHTWEINSLNDVVVDQMYQHWRTFSALINQGLSGKTSGLDKLCLSRAQILWGEPTVETRSKRKEKVDVTHGEGIELLSKVALTEEAQMKEVRKKSLRDFHKLHPSGSGIVAKKPPRVEKITPTVTSEGTGDKPEKMKAITMRTKSDNDKTPSDSEKDSDSEQDTDGSESNSKTYQQEYQEEVKDDDDDKSEGDKDRGMDSDDVQDNKDPLHTQVTALVDDHLDTRMGATREEFMNFLSASLTDKITKQVRNQLPQILPEEVSNFALPVIKKMITESLNQDKHEGPFAGSDRRLKKRKTRKDAEPTTSPKNKDSPSRSSKGTKSQPKSSGKSVHAEEPEFKVGDTDTPQGQEGNHGNDDVEPMKDFASRRDWFIKPLWPEEHTNRDWNKDKTP
nr:hypothetical protein [Tanacetum cinerariifolium]